MTEGSTYSLTGMIARIITGVFHPVLMPVYGLLIIFSAPTLFGFLPFNQKKFIFLVLLTNNVLLPLSLIPYLKWRNIISTWAMENRRERIIPLSVTSLFYFVTAYLALRLSIPGFIKAFILATSLLSLSITIINFWFKISVHSAGAGALTSLIVVLSVKMHSPLTPYLIASIIVSGMVMSSRLYLNSHNSKEVWVGYFTGIAGVALLLLLV